jgi:hypothetical protein
MRSGSGANLTFLYLKAPGGAMNLTNCRFYDATGTMILSGIAAAAITIPLTTSYQSLEALVQAQSGGTAAWESIKDSLAGFEADAVTAQVDVSFGQAAATVPSMNIAATRVLRIGSGIPPEKQALMGATVNVSGEVFTTSSYRQSALTTVSLAANNDAITLPCVGYGQAVFDFITIVGTAPTMAPEISPDNGTTWKSAKSYLGTSGTTQSSSGTSFGVASNGLYFIDCSGATHVRFRATAINGGSVSTPHIVVGSTISSPWNPAPSVTSGALQVQGYNLHGAVAAAALLQIGAEGRATESAAVDSGDAVRVLATLTGKPVTRLHGLPDNGWDYAAPSGGVTTGTTTTIKTKDAGLKQEIIDFSVTNRSTTAVEVTIFACDSDTGAVADANSVRLWCQELKEGETAGISITGKGKPLRGGTAQALRYLTSATGKVYLNASGQKTAD